MTPEQAIKETANDFVKAAREERAKAEEEAEEPVLEQPVDMYQQRSRAIKRDLTPRSFGANPKLKVDLGIVEQSGIEYEYRKAKNAAEAYKREGDTGRARLVMEAYMQDKFLPVIDALVGLNGPQAVLGSRETLDTLDGYALIPGGGTHGYSAAFINSTYDTTTLPENSDGYVRYYMRELRGLCGDGQIRTATGLANQLKESIDKGEHIASPEDYEDLTKIVFKNPN